MQRSFPHNREPPTPPENGAKRVVVSAPVKDGPPNIVMGVNHESFDPKEASIVTAASCTTNCLAPVVRVLHDAIGIERGSVTTIHAPTTRNPFTTVLYKILGGPCIPDEFDSHDDQFSDGGDHHHSRAQRQATASPFAPPFIMHHSPTAFSYAAGHNHRRGQRSH